MTARMDENFEITSEARNYNNEDIDETQSEIYLDDEVDPDSRSRDVYEDPFTLLDGGMAATDSFSLWKSLIPIFEQVTRLDFFRQEIKAGRKMYKDFYVFFRQNLLSRFDQTVC